MVFAVTAAEHFTFESRLASFQSSQPLAKRRASNASSKAPKSLKWPHKFLSAQDLAKAGFFYHPLPSNPDNVICFLCHKAMDGWEEGDDPLAEHLKHSPDCGWAIVATIEAQDGELNQEYPLSVEMIEARKSTFADRWPHDGKKGWKCKTKQLVEAGWKYTPTPEYDDMATCTYCSLALDGWEPADKPMDEHHKRSPDCSFFTLINEHKQTPKKTKTKRASKASRLSTQSTLTLVEEPSVIDLPAEEDDSVLTTATTATQTGRKMTKGRKAAVPKARKTRAKKEEPVEVEDAPEPEDADFEVKVETAPKPTRGKKRKSEDAQESNIADVESQAHPPKRRATRTRASVAVDDSILAEGAPAKPKGRKGRVSKAKKNSTASVVPVDIETPNDDDIDRALEADLERHMSVEEKPAPSSIKKATRGSKVAKADHSMFGVGVVQVDEAAIEAELEAMEIELKPLPKAKGAKGKTTRKPSAKQQAAAAKKAAEEEAARAVEQAEQVVAEEEASQQILADLEQSVSINHISPMLQPKKQRAALKRTSRQPATRTTRGSVMSMNDNTAMPGSFVNEQEEQSGNETDASMASQSTVVRGGGARRGSTLKKSKLDKKAAPRNTEEIIHKNAAPAQASEEPSQVGKRRKVLRSEAVSMTEDFYTPAPEAAPIESIEPADRMDVVDPEFDKPDFESTPAKSPIRPKIQQTLTAMVEYMSGAQASTSSKAKQAKLKSPLAPTPPPREATVSQSPQSSDAENHPPSSRPSLSNKKTPTPLAAPAFHASTPRTTTTRIPLADTTSTPLLSPSKRNKTISGLQSSAPWRAAELETIFLKSPIGDENGLEIALVKARQGELTSPEKKMTVEEWILYNAGLAEEKLKRECEGMVGVFEQQGGRAMMALEGIEALE